MSRCCTDQAILLQARGTNPITMYLHDAANNRLYLRFSWLGYHFQYTLIFHGYMFVLKAGSVNYLLIFHKQHFLLLSCPESRPVLSYFFCFGGLGVGGIATDH